MTIENYTRLHPGRDCPNSRGPLSQDALAIIQEFNRRNPDHQIPTQRSKDLQNPVWIDCPFGQVTGKPDDVQDSDPKKVEINDSLETGMEPEQDKDGYPINPVCKTGIRGRGTNNQWGPIYAVDIVIYDKDADGTISVLTIKRKDGSLAFPGGMVDGNEDSFHAALRELSEETDLDIEILSKTLDKVELYSGYSDDPRNTDNSWFETTVFAISLDHIIALSGTTKESIIASIKGGDDAISAQFTKVCDMKSGTYANHRDYADLIDSFLMTRSSAQLIGR